MGSGNGGDSRMKDEKSKPKITNKDSAD